MEKILSELINNTISSLKKFQEEINSLTFEKRLYELQTKYSNNNSYLELTDCIVKRIKKYNTMLNEGLINILNIIGEFAIYEIKEKRTMPLSVYFLKRCISLTECDNVNKDYIIKNVIWKFEHVSTVSKLYSYNNQQLFEVISYFTKY